MSETFDCADAIPIHPVLSVTAAAAAAPPASVNKARRSTSFSSMAVPPKEASGANISREAVELGGIVDQHHPARQFVGIPGIEQLEDRIIVDLRKRRDLR